MTSPSFQNAPVHDLYAADKATRKLNLGLVGLRCISHAHSKKLDLQIILCYKFKVSDEPGEGKEENYPPGQTLSGLSRSS